ncbi:MAG: hypothetical protein M3Q69_20240 [Acidobacteriota bacterium]|nr:hypothetical protein [Acidobacteriota bacterium]
MDPAKPTGVSPPISGSYRGFLTAPAGAAQRLDLRIDVDPRIINGVVLNRVSGDIFRVDKINIPGRPPKQAEVYQESWILEVPAVQMTSDAIVITGAIRFWNAVHPKTAARIRIPLQPAGAAAEVTLLRQSSPPLTFACPPSGIFFRAMRLEVDVCQSVNVEPTLPTYGTHMLKQRPPSLPDRTLTVDRTYAEAGVEMLLRTDKRSIIDDTADGFQAWTDAELHNAMERNFTEYQGTWPKWEMWGLLAGTYEDDLVGGIMFDYAAAAGGPGKAPERQGFAVFRRHEWFDSLVANPKTPEQFEAARKFLYTFTHEAGHAFNLLHSWDKNRASALSWMNYDWKYDQQHGEGEFWKNFRFRFDDEELLHIRHGNRPSVIMGGDPWSSGGHAESPPGAEHLRMPPGAMVSVSGEVPLEFIVRSQPYFEFLEPVSIELRVRNTTRIPISVSSTLHPEFGSVTIYVRRPDGRIVEYMPVSCKLANERSVILSPAGAADGSDRHSRSVFVSYGRYGFYFDEPGQYYIRAVYHGPGNALVPSNVERIRIGHPKSEQADRLAQDFFSYESGAALYLGGSHADSLSKGMDTLMNAIDEQNGTFAAAKIAGRIARGVGMPFHDVQYDADAAYSDAAPPATVRRKTEGDVERALVLTEVALESFRDSSSDAVNLHIERAARTRKDLYLRMGDEQRARDEMTQLAADLVQRGVKDKVVSKVANEAEAIGGSVPPARPRKPRSRRRS